jgi:hypothetical protein
MEPNGANKAPKVAQKAQNDAQNVPQGAQKVLKSDLKACPQEARLGTRFWEAILDALSSTCASIGIIFGLISSILGPIEIILGAIGSTFGVPKACSREPVTR